MNLNISDIVELLQISEKTLNKWIKDKKIPHYKINNQFLFNKSEINDWILKNNINISGKIINLNSTNHSHNLKTLIDNGGIFYDIEGSTVKDIIKNSVDRLKLPEETNKEMVLLSLLERESMMPTSIGKGIAIPHPRNPIIANNDHESISICILKDRIDYKALDGEPVHTIFIILSSNPKRHLENLSKISFLCHQNDFINILSTKSPKDVIIKYIINKEHEWVKI